MVRILNAEPEGFSPQARAILASVGPLTEEQVPQHRLASQLPGYDVLIVRLGLRVTGDVLRAGDRLSVIASATTGLDHIDVDKAASLGITVLSLQGETAFLRSIPATAEHTWALLLALVRRIPWAFESVRRGEWDRDRFRGRDLAGRRFGILGFGRIGERVARYALAFGMEVGAYNPHRTFLPPEMQHFETVEALLGWSEVLSIHLPLNAETAGFLDERRLRMLPTGALLLNTARGGIVDERALTTLLEEGHLAGAAADVLSREQPAEEREGNPLFDYLRRRDNLLVTPHLGGATHESMERAEVFIAQKIRLFFEGATLSAAPDPPGAGPSGRHER